MKDPTIVQDINCIGANTVIGVVGLCLSHGRKISSKKVTITLHRVLTNEEWKLVQADMNWLRKEGYDVVVHEHFQPVMTVKVD